MAGIQSLLGGGLKSFGVDKLSENLPPKMRELLPFALNPQGYIVGKAVNSLADYLGYGNEARELQAGAKDEKDYYKETMRDAIGNVLPDAIGDFVRVTPRATTDEPAGTYYDAETQDWKQSLNPVMSPNSGSNFENFVRNEQYGTMTPGQGKYVGPLPEDNAIFQANVSNLPYDLGLSPTEGMPEDFDIELLRSILQSRNIPNNTVNEYGDPMGNFSNNNSGDQSQGGSSEDEFNDLMTSMTAIGGGTPEMREKGIENLANGGFIYRGIR